MSETICVVTGATGHIGRELTRLLLERGVRVRAVARNPEHLKALEKSGAESMAGSIDDQEFNARAFTGASAVFTMIPPNYLAADFRAYQNQVSEALAAGVERSGARQVVNLSSVGAQFGDGVGPINGLHDGEQRFNRIAAAHVVHLRPTFFMENHLAAISAIQANGVYGGALKPEVKLGMIATRDVAAAAAALLAEPRFTGKTTRELLGPRDFTMNEAARILGAAIGRPDLPYVQFPYEGVLQALIAMGMSANAADLMIEMQRAINDGKFQPTESRSPGNTTRTTLEEFAREAFAPAFRG